MFGRRRVPPQAVPRAAAVLPSVHAQPILVADPDTPAIVRERSLRNWTGRTLQGRSGTVIDYDRGDPAHSVSIVMPGVTNPSEAYARIGMKDTRVLAQTEIYDIGTADEGLTAYQASMLARIAR